MGLLEEFLVTDYFGNTGKDYVVALTIFVGLVALIYLFKKIILMQLHHLSKKTKTDLDDYAVKILQGLGWPFYLQLAFNFSVRSLLLSHAIQTVLDYLLLLVLVYYLVKSLQLIIDVASEKYIIRGQSTDPNQDPSIINVFTTIIKVCVWLVALLFIMSNFGINISALVAGLGIGGIAIAFALQNVLSDIFASFSIYFDKPFKIGDTIQIGTDQGIVRKIGIKSTRIETLQGQELIISNKELTNSRINNFKKMNRRRFVFTISLSYDTSPEKLREIPGFVAEIIKKVKEAEIERVHFTQLGDNALMFEIAYTLKNPDMNHFLDAQQEINFRIMEKFRKEKIIFAKNPLLFQKTP